MFQRQSVRSIWLIFALVLLCVAGPAPADEPAPASAPIVVPAPTPAADAAPPAPAPPPAAEVSLGDGPLSGPRWGRPPLTGDWFGARRVMAEKGLTFGIDVVDIVQSIVEGGTDSDTENNGSVYFEAHFDTQKAGLWPGGFLDLRVEKSFGETINAKTATVLGANMVGLFPDGDDKTVVISKLMFTQFLAEWAGVFIGRFDTADGDGNHFASGRGRTQFLSARLTFSPLSALTTPYVLMGGGVIFVTPNPLTKHPGILNVLVADPQVAPDSSGFDADFFDEQYYAAEYRLPTRFFGLPGSQDMNFNYNTIEHVELGELLEIILPGQEAEQNQAWVLGYNFHQYLYVREGQDTVAKGYDPNTEQLEGFGMFGRFSYSNGDVNPGEFYFALGLGGRGLGSMRRSDTYGAAVYMTKLSDDFDPPIIEFNDTAWAFETYYNVEIMPWLHLTPNLQVLEPLLESVDTSVVLGLRTKVDF